MSRVPMESFDEGTEIVRVYLAATLAEAQDVERSLDATGFEYAVEVEAFASPTVLGSNAARRGAGFWVRSDGLDACANVLAAAGLVRGLVDRG